MSDYTSKTEALRFLQLLDPTETNFTFQTFDDNYDRKEPALARVFNGTLEDNWPALEAYSEQGAGVFITVNRTNLKGRRQRHMEGTRANWVEDDGDAEGKPLPITPNFVTESSPGHFHKYILHDLPKSDFAQIQNTLVTDYGSDPSAKDYTRVLRLPGFPHQKVRESKGLTGEKFMVKISEDNGIEPYTHGTLAEHFKFNGHATADIVMPTAVTITPDDKMMLMVEEALTFIPCDDRGDWVAVSHAVKLMGGNMYPLWDAWSKKGDSYDSAKNMDVWASLQPDRTDVTALFHKAKNHGMEPGRVDDCIFHVTTLGFNVGKPNGVVDFMNPTEVNLTVVNRIGNERWLYDDLILAECITVVCAPPGGGKTAILFDIAQQIARKGEDNVFYISADSNPQDIKRMYPMAVEAGVHLHAPDFREGESMAKVIARFDAMVASNTDLTGNVFFIDTFKKMVDMINKREVKRILELMRSMVSRGATVVLVAHTNKYKGEDGTLVYEGTGDVRADVDNLIYFYPDKDELTRDLTVTTAPDKERGIFHPVTFTIDGMTREVVREDTVIDTKEIHAHKMQMVKDADTIQLINEVINGGSHVKGDIVKAVVAAGGANKKTRDVLARYSVEQGVAELPLNGSVWEYKRGDKNSMEYFCKTEIG